MTKSNALRLHNEDEVTVNRTGEVTTVLRSYQDDEGQVVVETTYQGFTKFYHYEIS